MIRSNLLSFSDKSSFNACEQRVPCSPKGEGSRGQGQQLEDCPPLSQSKWVRIKLKMKKLNNKIKTNDSDRMFAIINRTDDKSYRGRVVAISLAFVLEIWG